MRLTWLTQIILLTSILVQIPSSTVHLFPPSLLERLHQVTVKIQTGDIWGSGVIVKRQGSIYWVITNAHVLAGKQNYCIYTHNQKSYAAIKVQTQAFKGLDVGMLVFSTQKNYTIQSLSSTPDSLPETPVIAVGYPFAFQDNKEVGYVALPGKIKIVLDTPLTEGFSVAYSNAVSKGMSGGGIFNTQGELVGINGIQAYPLWSVDYKYINGKPLNPQLNEQLQKLSIGILASIIKQRLKEDNFLVPPVFSSSCPTK